MGLLVDSDGDCRRIGSITAKIFSHLNRLDVYRVVRAGKQRRNIEKSVGWSIDVVKTADFPRVSRVIVLTAADATASVCGGTAAENPESLAVGVVLAWINVDVKLRLGGGGRPNHRQSQPKPAESRPFRP